MSDRRQSKLRRPLGRVAATKRGHSKQYRGSIRFPPPDQPLGKPKPCVGTGGLLGRFRKPVRCLSANHPAVYDTEYYSSDMVSVELAADTTSMASKQQQHTKNAADPSHQTTTTTEVVPMEPSSVPQFVVRRSPGDESNRRHIQKEATTAQAQQQQRLAPKQQQQSYEEAAHDGTQQRVETRHRHHNHPVQQENQERKVEKQDRFFEEQTMQQDKAMQDAIRTFNHPKKSLFDSDSGLVATFHDQQQPEPLEALQEENSILECSRGDQSSELQNLDAVYSPSCSAGSSSLIQRIFTTEQSENGSSKNSELSSPIFGFFGPKSTEGSTTSGSGGMDKNGKQALATMQKMVLKQQESIKTITEQNEYFKSMLLTYQKQMDRLTDESAEYQETVAQMVVQKETIETESAWLRKEVTTLKHELEEIKNDNDLKERWSQLMEDDTKSNTDESTHDEEAAVEPRDTMTISDSFEKEIMNVTPLQSEDIVGDYHDNVFERSNNPQRTAPRTLPPTTVPRETVSVSSLSSNDKSRQAFSDPSRTIDSSSSEQQVVRRENSGSYSSSGAYFQQPTLRESDERNRAQDNKSRSAGGTSASSRENKTSSYVPSSSRQETTVKPIRSRSPPQQVESKNRKQSNPRSDSHQAFYSENIPSRESSRSNSVERPRGDDFRPSLSTRPSSRYAVSAPMEQTRPSDDSAMLRKTQQSPSPASHGNSNSAEKEVVKMASTSSFSSSGRSSSSATTGSSLGKPSPRQQIFYAASLASTTTNSREFSSPQRQRSKSPLQNRGKASPAQVSESNGPVSKQQQDSLRAASLGSTVSMRKDTNGWVSPRQNRLSEANKPKKLPSESYFPHSNAFHQGLERFQNASANNDTVPSGKSSADPSRDAVKARRLLFEKISSQARDDAESRLLERLSLPSQTERDDPDHSVSSEDVNRVYRGISQNSRDEVALFKNRLDQVQKKRRERLSSSPTKVRHTVVRFGGIQSSE